MAIREATDNRGTLRKAIWHYIQNEFKNTANYRDFLISINKLVEDGKLINKEGYYFVHETVYGEFFPKQDPTGGAATPVRLKESASR